METGPNDSGLSAYHISAACEASLKRLKMDRIDLYQMHHSDMSVPQDEIWQALDLLVQQGKVFYVGSHPQAARRRLGRSGSPDMGTSRSPARCSSRARSSTFSTPRSTRRPVSNGTALGFEGSEVTGKTGDGGVDATGELNVANRKVRVYVQAKRYKRDSTIAASTPRAPRQATPFGGGKEPSSRQRASSRKHTTSLSRPTSRESV